MLAASEGDSAALTDSLLEVASIAPTANLAQMRREMDEMLAKHMRSGGGISTAAFQVV